MKIVLIGNLTIDENIVGITKYKGAGGSVYFLAKTFENLEVTSTIVSPYGADFPKKTLPYTNFIPSVPEFQTTLIFKNNYSDGRREQIVANYKPYLNYAWTEKVKAVQNNADIVILAPILNNIDASEINNIKEYFPNSFFCLLPQGLYRQIDSLDKVYRADSDLPNDLIENFDFICLSVDDIDDVYRKVIFWSRKGPLVVITQAGKGSSLYVNGNKTDTDAYDIPNVSDPTGAGDVFAGAFCFAYFKSQNLKQSAQFANATAALSLRVVLNPLQYNYQDIMNFAAGQDRPIIL